LVDENVTKVDAVNVYSVIKSKGFSIEKPLLFI